jgi:hypothetical protein
MALTLVTSGMSDFQQRIKYLIGFNRQMFPMHEVVAFRQRSFGLLPWVQMAERRVSTVIAVHGQCGKENEKRARTNCQKTWRCALWSSVQERVAIS